MNTAEKLEWVAIIAAGVVIGNVLSMKEALFLPQYLLSQGNVLYHKYLFNKKYQRYLADASPIGLIDQEEGTNVSRKILILCHGRTHPILYLNLINYEEDCVRTIDINPEVYPHYATDLSNPTCFKSVPNNSIDIIIYQLCICCTQNVESNSAMGTETLRILKNDGQIWIRRAGYRDDSSVPDWLSSNFQFDRKINSNECDMAPEPQSYSTFMSDCSCRFIGNNVNLEVWKPKQQ